MFSVCTFSMISLFATQKQIKTMPKCNVYFKFFHWLPVFTELTIFSLEHYERYVYTSQIYVLYLLKVFGEQTCCIKWPGSFGPRREKTCLRGFANNTGADQPAHPRSLISAFVIRFLESTICTLATGEI